MGLAIIVPGMSFDDANLGKVTLSGNEPIRRLYINLEDSYFGTEIDLKCSYSPANTVQRDVIWSIESGSEYASIDGSTLSILPEASLNDVTIKCTSVSNPSVAAEKTIKVIYGGEIVWRDFTEDMIVEGKVIDSDTGQIKDGDKSSRQVLLLPIPHNASALMLKRIGDKLTSPVSFIAIDNLNNTPVDATHSIKWVDVNSPEISIPIQNGDVSVVCWQQVSNNILGIGNIQYSFT